MDKPPQLFVEGIFKLGSIYYLHRSLRMKDVELLINMLLLLPEARFLYELMRIP